MVESNKILTVSYGTFSCTLEGFDDAFDTMKAIAEYFRDLAADDRYFGAEPPTPDAEMLTRLAERSISRRVNARSEDGNIVLSPDAQGTQGTPDAAHAAPEAPTGEAAQPAPVAAPQPADVSQARSLPVDQPAPTPVVAQTDPQIDDEDDVPALPQRAPRISAALAAARGAAELAAAPTIAPRPKAETQEAETAQSEAPQDSADAQTARMTDALVAPAPSAAPALKLPDPEDIALEAPAASRHEVPTVEAESVAPEPVQDVAEADAPDLGQEGIAEELPVATQIDHELGTADAPVSAAATDEELDHLPEDHAEQTSEAMSRDTLLLDSPLPERAASAAPEAPTPEADSPAPATIKVPETEVDVLDWEDLAENAPVDAAAEQDAADPVIEAYVEAPEITAHPEIAEAEAAIAAALATDTTWVTIAPARPDPAGVAWKLQHLRTLAADATGGDIATDLPTQPAEAPTPHVTLDEGSILLDDTAPLPPIAEDEDAFSSTIGAADGAEDQALEAEGLDASGADSLFAEDADDTVEATPRIMARVVKVQRREELGGAPNPGGESSLSAQEEDELQRELAALEREIARGNAPEEEAPALQDEAPEAAQDAPSQDEAHWDAPAEVTEAPQPEDETPPQAAVEEERNALADLEVPARPMRSLRESARDTLRAADHSDQMDRILRETDHHFEEAGSTRRRSALAHLRAAVAAKKAEKAAGSDFAAREDTTDAYREDLAQVVRPRRPAIAHRGDAPSRRVESRPAPLKLVAEQRIDTATTPSGPVRPRRVSVADLARRDQSENRRAPITSTATPAHQPDESFDDYVASFGARALGDLLEAAASYISFMEGQPLFSRPQLMARVKSLAPAEFSREDGLRAFGQLLRDGKIRKAEAGRFAVSESIGFRPEERAAG